ncbi:unnamed protein product [Coregonus sp. 'balchen']|nr:unnamed protein product [Coregonus sp. 'balchen']
MLKLFVCVKSQLAPENTLMSFKKAVEAGGEGVPQPDGRPCGHVHLGELETLNAGAWFLYRDPFGTAWSLGAEDRVQAQNQSVCSLRDFLELAAQRGKQVIFDLYRPPRGHPYRDTWITHTLEFIQNDLVQEMDPDLQQTSGSRGPVEELQQNHIVQLNLHYSSMSTEMISEYAAANISTNLYVISQPWLYSLAWCAGAQSVTTNAPQLLNKLTRPLFLMTPDEYNLMWVLTDVVSFILILIIFIFHCDDCNCVGDRWRERGLAFCSGSKPTLETRHLQQVQDSVNILGEPAGSPLATEPNLAAVSEH